MRAMLTYTVADEGRDRGKVFILKELPASQAEAWAMRAILALMAGGVDMPEGLENMNMAMMAEIGFNALARLDWDKVKPLTDEMWTCVQIQPDPKNPSIVRHLIEEDVEEIGTRFKLRAEVFKLHTDFFKAAAPSISPKSTILAAAKEKGL